MKSQDPNLKEYDAARVELRLCRFTTDLGSIRFRCTKKLGHLDEHSGCVEWANESEEALAIRFAPEDQREALAAQVAPSKIPSQAVAEVMNGYYPEVKT